MHPYIFLKSIFEELGFTPNEEELRPDVFGSAWAIYATQSAQLRLVWDGKDGVGFLDSRSQATERWETVSEVLTEGDVEVNPKNEKKIAEFRRTIESFNAALGGESRVTKDP